jgi:hypothetical protein
MSQFQLIANLDQKEFLDPYRFSGSAAQIVSLNGDSDGVMFAFTLLLAVSNARSGGSFRPWQTPEDEQVASHLIGRWAGDRIAIVGDYYRAESCDVPLGADSDPGLYETISSQSDSWVDISEHMVELLELDPELKARRHELHAAPSGATWTEADAFRHGSPFPKPPRSLFNRETGQITAIPELPEPDPQDFPVEAEPLAEQLLLDLREALATARGMMGGLSPERQEAIEAYCLHPNREGWAKVAHTSLHGLSSLWAAICKVDPEFPASLPHQEYGHSWPSCPSGGAVLAALRAESELPEWEPQSQDEEV